MPANNSSNSKLTTAIAKYQAAVGKNNSESEVLWSRYNTMLLFNSVLLTAIGLTSNSSDYNISEKLKMFLPYAGLISCYFWFITTLRGFQWIEHWIISARKIEKKYLMERIDEVTDFDPLNRGNEEKSRIIGWPKTPIAAYMMIILIGILYLFFIIH